MRIPEQSGQKLQRLARRYGQTVSEVGARLVEEGLRKTEFAFLEFRDTATGRHAFLQGTRLAVWMVVKIGRAYGNDVEKTAQHLSRSPVQIQAALNYAKGFPQEIETVISDNDSISVEKLSFMLPGTETFRTRKA